MSQVSDFKVAPFATFPGVPTTTSNYSGTATPPGPGYTPTAISYGGVTTYDTSYDTLCGMRFDTTDGRQVVIVRNGGTGVSVVALTSGKLVQAPAEITAFNNLAITVPTATPATVGTNQILVTNGSTVLKQNQFALGYLVVSAGTGIGQTLQIASHAGGANAGTFLVTLIDPIQITLDATSTVTLVPNKHIGVVVAATGLTGAVVGVPFYPIAAGTASTYDGTTGAQTAQGQPIYAFVGCHGVWGVTMDGTNTPAVGLPASVSTTTAGTATVFTAAKQLIGNMAGTGTSAKVAPVDLLL